MGKMEKIINSYPIFFDIETDGFNGKTLYIHAVSDDYDCGFLNENDFVDFIIHVAKKKKKVIFYAHNGGDFDFVRLFPYLLQALGEPTKIITIHGRLVYFYYKFSDCKIIFKDTYLLIPTALKNFDKLFELDVSKQKIENITKLSKTNFEKVKEYCRMDCIVLKNGFYKFCEYVNTLFRMNVNLEKTLTLPSLAFKYFKKQSKYDIPNISSQLLRHAYTGGRTEIFRLWYDDEFYVYDVNSMYPFVMQTYKYPVSTIVKSEPDLTKEGISIVKVYGQKYDDYPFAFYKDDITKKLYFPIFDIPKIIIRNNFELRRMKELGYDFDVIRSYISEENGYLFDFIKEMYEQRKRLKNEGKIGLSEILKLLMNSIYGKFGQNKNREEIWFSDDFNLNTRFYFKWGSGQYYVNTKTFFKKSVFSNLLIASYITAYARSHLYNLMKQCYNPLYVDTDSCFSVKKLSEGNGLGDVKLESIGVNFISLQPKVYIYKKESDDIVVKAKGFPKKIFDKFNVEHTDVVLAYLKNVGVKIENATKFKKLLFNLSKNKQPFDTPASIKFLTSQYNKRIVVSTGKTYPIPISYISGRKICRDAGITENTIKKLDLMLSNS